MTTISIRCEMNDYGAFKQAYDANQKLMADMGVIASTMYQNLDDPNVVTVHHQCADLDVAKAMAAQWRGAEFREATKQQGFALVDTMEVTLLQHVA